MFNFKQFCDVANHMHDMGEESYDRSAISRYYYSIFCCVRMYLVLVLNEFEFASGRDVHSRICNRLIESDDDTEKALGLKLEELRQLRNDADYNWDRGSGYFHEHALDVKRNTRLVHQYLNVLKNAPPYKI